MNSADLRSVLAAYGLSQSELSRRLGIPIRTVQGWTIGERTPPEYVTKMIEFCLAHGADFREQI